MTDKMTAEKALEWLESLTGTYRSADPLAEKSQRAQDAAAALRQALTAPRVPDGLEDYDAGLLNDYGGGNVSWWHDYIRYEVDKANDWWRQQVEAENPAAPATADSELARLREALDKIQAIADGYVSEGELPVMVVVQTICKQALAGGSDE